MFSNTTARPRCLISLGVAAEGLMIAPSGHRLPRSTAMPEFFLKGFLKGKITARFQHGALLLFSQRLFPFPVSASACRRPVGPDLRAGAFLRASTAGIAALPGMPTPSASTIEAIVEAVPMVMQWP